MYDPLLPYNPQELSPADQIRQWEEDPLAPEQPSTALWDRIAADLPAQPRRRVAAWWWAGTSLLLVLLGGAYWQWSTPPTKPEQLSPQPQTTQLSPIAQAPELCPDNEPTNTPHTEPAHQFPEPISPLKLNSAMVVAIVDEGVPPAAAKTGPSSSAQAFDTSQLRTTKVEAAGVGLLRADGPVRLMGGLVSPLVAAPLRIPHANLAFDQVPVVQKKEGSQKASLSLAIFVAPATNKYSWQTPIPPGGGIPLRSSQSSDWSLEHGLRLRYQWHEHWSVSTGIALYKGRLNSVQRFRRAYDPTQEQAGSNGENISTYALGITNPYGDAEVEVALSRGSAEPAPTPSFLFFTLASQQELRSIQLPLQIGYHLGTGRWNVSLHTGPSWQSQRLQNLRTRVQVAAPRTLRPGPARILHTNAETNLHFFNWSAALEMSYSLNHRWQLYTQAFGQSSITPINPLSQTHSQRYGCQMGISMKLF